MGLEFKFCLESLRSIFSLTELIRLKLGSKFNLRVVLSSFSELIMGLLLSIPGLFLGSFFSKNLILLIALAISISTLFLQISSTNLSKIINAPFNNRSRRYFL